MRIRMIILFLSFGIALNAQKSNHSFSGALELGLGWGIPVDFTLHNNHLTSKYLFHRLFEIPWMAGAFTYRVLDSKRFFEFGMLYHRRSFSWASVYAYTNGKITYYLNEHHVLALNCIDISLKYYKYLTYWKNREIYAFGGLAPAWILSVPYSSDMNNNSIPEQCFRKAALALNGGLCYEKGDVRWKLHMDLGVLSLLNKEYAKEIPENDRAWGPRIYPFEILVVCAYLIQ